MDLSLLVENVPFILIIGGITAASWLLEKLLRPTPLMGKPISGAIKGMALIGFIIGIILLITAAGSWWVLEWDRGTRILLTLTGLALFLKPLKDVPWAAATGVIIGGLCVGLVLIFFPLPETVLGISSMWIYLAIFFVPTLITYLFFKFIEDLLRLIAMILSFKPILILLGLLCIAQGFLLLLENSLFSIIF